MMKPNVVFFDGTSYYVDSAEMAEQEKADGAEVVASFDTMEEAEALADEKMAEAYPPHMNRSFTGYR
jgi:hypothetical protein